MKQQSTELTPGVFSFHCEHGTKLARAIWSLHVQRQHVCGDHVLWPKQIMGMGLLQPTLPLNVPTKDLAWLLFFQDQEKSFPSWSSISSIPHRVTEGAPSLNITGCIPQELNMFNKEPTPLGTRWSNIEIFSDKFVTHQFWTLALKTRCSQVGPSSLLVPYWGHRLRPWISKLFKKLTRKRKQKLGLSSAGVVRKYVDRAGKKRIQGGAKLKETGAYPLKFCRTVSKWHLKMKAPGIELSWVWMPFTFPKLLFCRDYGIMMGSMLTSKESPPPRKSSKKEPSKKSHPRGELGFSKPYRRVTLLNTSWNVQNDCHVSHVWTICQQGDNNSANGLECT